MSSHKVSVIYASTLSGGIGLNGCLPWKSLPRDMRYLKFVTSYTGADNSPKNVVIMGRKTFQSIPPNRIPLEDRINVVLSRTVTDFGDGIIVAQSYEDAFKKLESIKFNKIFSIGGYGAYKSAYDLGLVDRVFVTRVNKEFPADTFVPPVPDNFELVGISKTYSHNNVPFDFVIYRDKSLKTPLNFDLEDFFLTDEKRRGLTPKHHVLPYLSVRRHEELQYLEMIADILNSGDAVETRTGVGALAKFGYKMEFDLSESFPLLTTKKVFMKGIVEELLWFIKGDTSGKKLLDRGVRIWEGNGTREFLDKIGLTEREEHDLGPIYGFQWRHFGAEYLDCHTNYLGQGIDQLMNAINLIKNDPTSRRMIVCSWNPADLSKMALPPCHCLYQFYVHDGKLSSMMYQRSADVALGVPFNIASYSLLTMMIAQVTGLKPGKFVHIIANAHVYNNHIEPITDQLNRVPYPFPVLKLNKEVKNIDEFAAEDIKVLCYVSHPTIKMEMNA